MTFQNVGSTDFALEKDMTTALETSKPPLLFKGSFFA
jgi:hypothetical protein